MTKQNTSGTPLFPDFNLHTLRRPPRSAQQILHRKRLESARKAFEDPAGMLHGYLPEGFMPESDRGAGSRHRLFNKRNTFFAFLRQVWSDGGACQEAVHYVRERAQAKGWQHLPSCSTSAYVQARKRLPLDEIVDVFTHGVDRIGRMAPGDGRPWIGVDGTGFSMPDTESNQREWPQPPNQKPGIGFPVLKLVGAFCLETGHALNVEIADLNTHELQPFRAMGDGFAPGDIVIGDRAYCSWYDLHALRVKGVDTVVRLHARREAIPTREARKVLGENDLLVAWDKPIQATSGRTSDEWKALPERLEVRQVTFRVEEKGFRTQSVTLVTTLTDPVRYPVEKLREMYRRRWQVETCFAALKISMGADELRCKSSEMIQKEIWMNLIAYNAIRFLQRKAGGLAGVASWRMSFKGSLEVARVWVTRFGVGRKHHGALRRELYRHLGETMVVERPGRVEPRVKKRRPKKVKLMTKPRRVLRDELMNAPEVPLA